MAELTDRDRGILQNDIDKLKEENTTLSDQIISDYREINNLLLADIPVKKFLDEIHYKIYALEEERRILTGKTIIGPVESNAFTVSTLEDDISLQIKDARFIAKKGDVVFVDVPIIDSRAYAVSSSASSPNFDIWTRDRRGSTTSEKNVPQSYTIHSGNNKFTVIIDGIEHLINIVAEDMLEAEGEEIIVEPDILAGNITLSMADAGISDGQCVYHEVNKTFSVISGTSGPTSTAQVIVDAADPGDIALQMKFQMQVIVPGRFANNKFKISIDGNEQELEITFDQRIPITSSLGSAIDDFSFDWKTDFSAGPMYPAQPNNGKKIATLIQNALRSVNSDEYSASECIYYSSSNKFVIYSGTFGKESSVEILSHSDADRDLFTYLKFDELSDLKNNEIPYTTMQSLYNYLNQNTVISCTGLTEPTRDSYSLLSIQKPTIISNGSYILKSTFEYDNAHLSRPRLYGNKLPIDSRNDKIDIDEGSGAVTRIIPHGLYNESELSLVLQDTLNVGSITYTISYKKDPKTFIIEASGSITFLFDTGINQSNSIATFIGFANTSDLTGTSFISNPISFTGEDFFSMAEIPQLVPMTCFSNQPPFYVDDTTISEVDFLSTESVLVQAENTSNTQIINDILTQLDVLNEVHLQHWYNVANEELLIVNNIVSMVGSMLALYSGISTTDANYLNLKTSLDNVIANRDSLVLYLSSSNYIMNLQSGNDIFTFNTDFTEGGVEQLNVQFSAPNADKIYNLPAIEFRYADNKFIPMKNVGSLYSNDVDFNPHIQIGFAIQSNLTTYLTNPVIDMRITITDTNFIARVFWSGGDDEFFNYDFTTYPNISELFDEINTNQPNFNIEYRAMLWSRYYEKFIVNNGEQFQITIGTGSLQTATFSMTAGSLTSGISPDESTISGDTLTLAINGEVAQTITFPSKTNTGIETAAMIQRLVRSLRATAYENQPGYSNFTCTFSGTYTLTSGNAGSGSSVNVTGGTLSTSLNLLGLGNGSGDVVNNYFVTNAELISKFSSFADVTFSDDSGFLKIVSDTAGDKITITSNSLATRLGFYNDNLTSDPAFDLMTVASSSLQNVSSMPIQGVLYEVLRGYENRGNITASFNKTNNVRLNARKTNVDTRRMYIPTRISQVNLRSSTIDSQLSTALYNSRWDEVIKRLNKSNGSYFKVGEKKVAITISEEKIIENEAKIADMEAMLS